MKAFCYLVVDVNEDIGNSLKLVIENSGSLADYENGSKKALMRLNSGTPIYSGVFVDTDIENPLTFLHRLREENSSIPIAIIDTNDIFFENPLNLPGFITYIQKPFSSRDIEKALNEMKDLVKNNM